MRSKIIKFIQETLSKILNYFKAKLESLEAKFYFFGIFAIALSMILTPKFQSSIIASIMTFTGILLFCSGILIWCYSLFKRKWIINLAKVFLVLLNIPTYLLSEILSRFLIAQTLNLPVKDFELTLKVLTSFFYIPVAIFLSCVILITLAFVVIILGMTVETITSSLPKFKYKFRWVYLCRAVGVALIAYGTNLISGNSLIQNAPLIVNAIKNVAFYGDYQEMQNYPTLKEGERVILHANGVISYASKKNNEVIIEIRKFKE